MAANHFLLLPNNALFRSHQFRFLSYLHSNSHHSPQIGQEIADEEQFQKLSVSLAQARTEDAKTLIKSIIDSPFGSPSELYSSFCRRAPSLRTIFFNTLLSVYAESKRPKDAAQLYTLIRKEGFYPSLSSFNLLLHSLVSSGQYAQALDFFAQVVDSGIWVDKFTYGKAIQSAVKLGDLKKGVDLMNDMKIPNIFVYNVLIDGFCKDKRIDEAHKLFDEMLHRKVAANCVTYTTLISGYCKMGKLNEALAVVQKMKSENVQPDHVTYTMLVGGFCKLGNVKEAHKLVHEMLENKVAANCVTYNTLMDGFCKMGKLNEAEKLLNEMLQREITADCVTYTTLINGYCKIGKLNEALAVVEKMKTENVQPNLFTYNTLIDGFCKLGNVKEAQKLVHEMLEKKVAADCFTYSTLMDGFCKIGKLDEADKLLNEMRLRKVTSNCVTYTTLINGYCKMGKLNEALVVLEKMKSENVQPDLFTFSSLLSGLSRSKSMEDTRKLLQEANEFFDDLKARALIPGADDYIKMINGHCGIEDFDGGYVWHRKMIENGFMPDKSTCNELVAGLRKLGRLQESEIVSSEMSSIKGLVKKRGPHFVTKM